MRKNDKTKDIQGKFAPPSVQNNNLCGERSYFFQLADCQLELLCHEHHRQYGLKPRFESHVYISHPLNHTFFNVAAVSFSLPSNLLLRCKIPRPRRVFVGFLPVKTHQKLGCLGIFEHCQLEISDSLRISCSCYRLVASNCTPQKNSKQFGHVYSNFPNLGSIILNGNNVKPPRDAF